MLRLTFVQLFVKFVDNMVDINQFGGKKVFEVRQFAANFNAL